jgi:predicted transcriptional regulator
LSGTPIFDDETRKGAIQALEMITKQDSRVNLKTTEKIEFQKHIGSLVSLGLVRTAATAEGVSYEISESGYRFLEQYQDIQRDTGRRVLDQPTSLAWLSIVVPCYNEEQTIGRTIQEILELGLPAEIIVVDNASTDRSVEILKSLPVRLVRHNSNLGLGMSIRSGIRTAKSDIIVIQHSDGEYPPRLITEYVKLLSEVEAVFGSRFLGRADGMSSSHKVGNVIISQVVSLLFNKKMTDVLTAAKAFRKSALDLDSIGSRGFEIEIEIAANLLRNGARMREIPIFYTRRRAGCAKIHMIDGLRLLLWAVRFRLLWRRHSVNS